MGDYIFKTAWTFTLLDILKMDTIVNDDNSGRDLNLAPEERIQLCFNILPGGLSYFHFLEDKVR